MTATKKTGIKPGDQILMASGLIVRNEPDAIVPAAQPWDAV